MSDEDNKREFELRDSEAPSPKSIEELSAYIAGLLAEQHTYGTCVYAMSLAAVAAFNLVAGQLGVTGFQASCADLDILKRTRRIDGPFIFLKGEDMLYPQYDLHGRLAEAMEKWKPWAAEMAKKFLAEREGAADSVIAHWSKLASES